MIFDGWWIFYGIWLIVGSFNLNDTEICFEPFQSWAMHVSSLEETMHLSWAGQPKSTTGRLYPAAFSMHRLGRPSQCWNSVWASFRAQGKNKNILWFHLCTALGPPVVPMTNSLSSELRNTWQTLWVAKYVINRGPLKEIRKFWSISDPFHGDDSGRIPNHIFTSIPGIKIHRIVAIRWEAATLIRPVQTADGLVHRFAPTLWRWGTSASQTGWDPEGSTWPAL